VVLVSNFRFRIEKPADEPGLGVHAEVAVDVARVSGDGVFRDGHVGGDVATQRSNPAIRIHEVAETLHEETLLLVVPAVERCGFT